MLSVTDFLKLKEGDLIAYCRKKYVVRGKTDTKEPQLVSIESGETLSGAVYAAHLMTYLGVYVPEENITEAVVEAPVMSADTPAPKRRGRPPKAKVEVPAVVEIQQPEKKRRGRPPKVKV